jgi:hypothetical protein
MISSYFFLDYLLFFFLSNSWLLTPVLFNPHPALNLTIKDADEMDEWLSTNYSAYSKRVKVKDVNSDSSGDQIFTTVWQDSFEVSNSL